MYDHDYCETPTRERAYARLIVAIVAEENLRGDARCEAVDYLTDRLTAELADDSTRQDGECIHPGLFAGPDMARTKRCHYCSTDVSVSDL